jgi:ABC-type transport system substrate-binding protein
VKFIADPAQRTSAFLANEGQLIDFDVLGPQINQIKAAGFTTDAHGLQGGVGWYMNERIPPRDDIRLRRALMLATDLDAVNDSATEGAALPADTRSRRPLRGTSMRRKFRSPRAIWRLRRSSSTKWSLRRDR